MNESSWIQFWELIERERAEILKKEQFYDPDCCPDQDEPGCTFPVCHLCEIDYGEDEDW